MSASDKSDRAAGLRPQPPAASSQSSIPSAWFSTESNLRDWLRSVFSKRGAATEFARERDLTDEQVLSFLRGARPPEPRLLEAIGYRREYRYSPCPCFRCTKARTDIDPGPLQFGYSLEMQRMFLCETCGNKRCPHAADHSNACTGSNEPGQPGSLYLAQGMPTVGGDALAAPFMGSPVPNGDAPC